MSPGDATAQDKRLLWSQDLLVLQLLHACCRRDAIGNDDVVDVERTLCPPLPLRLPQLSLRVAEPKGRVRIATTADEVGREGRV